MSEERTKWEEYEVQDMGRLMMRASALEDDLNDTELVSPSDEDREALRDALYHAHKAHRILSQLAVKSQREWHQAVASEEERGNE